MTWILLQISQRNKYDSEKILKIGQHLSNLFYNECIVAVVIETQYSIIQRVVDSASRLKTAGELKIALARTSR